MSFQLFGLRSRRAHAYSDYHYPQPLILIFSDFESIGSLFDPYETSLGSKAESKAESTTVNDADGKHEMLSRRRGFLEREARVK
jgi:hypothetical protein